MTTSSVSLLITLLALITIPSGQAVRRGFRENRHLPVASLFLPLDGWILPETRLSDHASFWDAGLPAVMVTDTALFRNPNYHLPSDTIDTLDFTFMVSEAL